MNAMENKTLKTNASGYYDEPCYKACTVGPQPGEIWAHSTSGAYMLVLATANGVHTTVRLNENPRDDRSIPVMCRAQMYANPSFLGYCFDNALGSFVKVAAKPDFEAVREAVVKLMGYDVGEDEESDEEVDEETEEELESTVRCRGREAELEAQLAKVKHELLEACTRNGMLQEELNKVGLEAEKTAFYKQMYNEMLDKVMALAMKGCA